MLQMEYVLWSWLLIEADADTDTRNRNDCILAFIIVAHFNFFAA